MSASQHLMVALVEDSNGQTFQFHAFDDETLNAKIAAWVRPRWREDFGKCPEDDADCLEVYFENMSGPPFAFPGFEHTLKVVEAIEIPEVGEVAELRRWKEEALKVMPDFQAIGKELGLPLGVDVSAQILPAIRSLKKQEGTPRSYLPSVLSEVAGNACYPMELYVNGELSFKLDSEDAEGDLKAIRAFMEFRAARRQNRPLTNRELYGVDDPDVVTHTDASGKVVRTKNGLVEETPCPANPDPQS